MKGGRPGERLVVCHNPLEAERDRKERERMVQKPQSMAGSGKKVPKKLLRSAAARRYLKLSGGTVRLNKTRVKVDARYDGKWVVRTNTTLPPQEIAQQEVGREAGVPMASTAGQGPRPERRLVEPPVREHK